MSKMHTTAATTATGAERALAALAPRWTTWITQTLQHTGPLVPNALWREHLRFAPYSTLIARVKQMTDDGLVQPRPKGAPIALSALGSGVQPLHTAVADWSRRHDFFNGPVAEAERTEDALRRLNHRHLLPTLGWVAEHPGAKLSEITDGLGISYISASYRLDQLLADGLLRETGRTAGRRGGLHLTGAGQEIPAVLAHVAAWAEESSPSPRARPAPAAVAAPRHVPRTAAALYRSPEPARPTASATPLLPTFSHVETVKPWTRPTASPLARRR
jgi:DNA-binding HxlR family transcriptional regulator